MLHTLIVIAGIGFLIFIHEFGHFLVAKRVGIRVERFSLGFGPVIAGFRRGDTEYVVSWIPLGGYVKMAAETPGEPSTGAPDEWRSKPIGQRCAVALAGVAMNAITAFAAFVIAFKIGVLGISPKVGTATPGWPAWEAGLREGDLILEVGGVPARSFMDVAEEIALSAGERVPIAVSRREPDGTERRLAFQVARRQESGIPQIGITPPITTVIDQVGETRSAVLKMPAQRADLRPGDEITAVDGTPVATGADLERALARCAGRPSPVPLRVRRGGNDVSIAITPQALWTLGIEPLVRVTARTVAQDMPAARSGLRAGDEILTVDGVPVDTYEGFQRAINQGALHALSVGVRGGDGTARTLLVEPYEDPREGRRYLGINPAYAEDHAVLAEPGPATPAFAAGLRGGDGVVGIDAGGPPAFTISRWADAEAALGAFQKAHASGGEVAIRYLRAGEARKAVLHGRGDLGLEPAVIVGAVRPDSPAGKLGLRRGDRLRYLRLATPPAGEPDLAESQYRWREMEGLAQAAGVSGSPLLLDWARDGGAEPELHHGEALSPVPVEPLFNAGRSAASLLGATLKPDQSLMVIPGFLEPCRQGIRRTRDEIRKIGRTVSRFFAPETESLSPRVLGGPILIFMSGDHFLNQGAGAFILFLGVISINLAVLNLLPVPVLDGGLLALLIVEKIRGAPLEERAMAIVQYAGLALVLSLVLFVTYNDIALRLLPIFQQ